ncbi:MazG family protein [Gottschalkia purinilytica]|uniref:MazG family protein n=1 Tax=Gottschalkia purinilytica TaxID=1503 RepID=A0A0L0W925_GOTPU|nr:nucleoside triphosphate pyrophosphohydrolase [Gottschalkia purinilytica]KNF07810.1 MazG family protein [Gottschalkia purinilytica]
MAKIVIIGLGPGDIGSLTMEAVERITDGNKVFLRTDKHPTVKYLREKQIDYETYDHIYEEEEDFDKVYQTIVNDLFEKSQKYGIINYCVPGHPLVAERTVSILMDMNNKGIIDLDIIPGLSFIEPVILSVGCDPVNGLKIVDGLDILEQNIDINVDNIVTQVYNRARASELKLQLMDIYGDEYQIYVIKSAGIKEEEKKVKIPLYQVDRLDWIDYLTSMYIPKMKKEEKNKYDMNNLLRIMEILRSKEGCPWDAKQTHESLRQYLIEEAYEVVDAIDSEDIDGIVEELGDVLLQVVFHSQIGKEEGYFNIWDVISGICNKLISRHPHVFSDYQANNSQEALESWNEIKAKEKDFKTYTDRLKDVPRVLPGLMRSYKIQKRAADVGFDWNDISGAIEKLHEEFQEVQYELNENNKERIEEEIGDFIFATVNVCRFLDIDPENALNKAINKFIERFEFIEKESIKMDKDIKTMNLEEMNSLWDKAKIHKISKKN